MTLRSAAARLLEKAKKQGLTTWWKSPRIAWKHCEKHWKQKTKKR